MEIYDRPNSGFWWYAFTVDGKRFRGSTKRPKWDKEGAQRVLAQKYQEAMNTKQFGEKPQITFRDAVERVVLSVDKPATVKSYRNSGDKFLGTCKAKPGIWHVNPEAKLHTLTDFMFEDFVEARKAEGLKPNSINIEIRFLKRMHNLARKRYQVDPDVTFPQLKSFSKTRTFSDEEEAQVLETFDANKGMTAYDKGRDLYVFLMNTGMRFSEAMALDWGDVDLTMGEIMNYNIKTEVETVVPINAKVEEILRRRHNQAQPFEEMSRGVRILRNTIHDICNQNDRVNMRKGKATIHTCRDTFATRLESRGMAIADISRLLGHTSITTTMKYANREKSEAAKEARKLLG